MPPAASLSFSGCPWANLSFITDADHAEALSEALFVLGAQSVSVEDADLGSDQETAQYGEPDSPSTTPWPRSRVIALFTVLAKQSDAANTHHFINLAAQAQTAAAITQAQRPEITPVPEEDWVRNTQAQFNPIAINDRLGIVPSWHAPNPHHEINLRLDPGLAFGTGAHPTTHLCLDWLCTHIGGGEHVLDYGCGSGILAIAARLLGAHSVFAVDIDTGALQAAAENATQNNALIHVLHADDLTRQISLGATTAQFDHVIANILTNPLCVLAPLLCSYVAPGGRLALAGVLEEQAPRVISAYAPWLNIHVTAVKEGWALLTGSHSC